MWLALVVASALLTGCGGAEKLSASDDAPAGDSSSVSTQPGKDSGKPYPRDPDAIVVLGHSGSTGESSDPDQPGVEVPKNSWVTGTNPDVRSLYQRILAVNPKIKGNELALSHASATVQDVLGQAQDAVERHPHNALVVIQVIDSDIVCPARQGDFDQFQKAFEDVLAELDRGLPSSRVLAVTQFGSPGTYAAALTPAQRRAFGDTGPCAFLDPQGHVVPRELRRLDAIIHGYEAAVGRGCAAFTRCVFDGGAFGAVVDQPEYIAEDLNHFSIAGHAKAAKVAWDVMRREGLVR